MSLPLPNLLFDAVSDRTDKLPTAGGRSAIHSGKLGDIIYALPVCRALGISHLYLNLYLDTSQPLRFFSLEAARSIVPLLLYQKYIKRVSIVHIETPLERVQKVEGVDYLLDHFRHVAWQRVAKVFREKEPSLEKKISGPRPAHLVEHFAALFGLDLDFNAPWLEAPWSPSRRGILFSVTQNWRTFPNAYWRSLATALPPSFFVGQKSEWLRARLPGSSWVETSNLLELASAIAASDIFLGTVSLPYAIAEALKVPRLVEPCLRNLNAFPVGSRGYYLPSRLPDALSLVGKYYPGISTARFRIPLVDLFNKIKMFFTPVNTSVNAFFKTYFAKRFSAG